MARMWSFNYDIAGVKYICNVVREDIGEALEVARERCADRVGDNFKAEARNDKYLRSIEVTEVEVPF